MTYVHLADRFLALEIKARARKAEAAPFCLA
jgi:hypothetical protein